MFTWICPQCGREVPPSYTECPDCAARAAQGGATPSGEQAQAPAAVAEAPPAPPVAAPPAPPQAYLPPRAYAPRRAGLPTWLMAILFAFAFIGLVAGIYWTISYVKGRRAAAPTASVESPAAKVGAKTNPLQRYIEVSGVRFLEDPKKKGVLLARFVLVNHSDADLTGLAGNVTIWGRTQRSEEDAEGTFSFTTDISANVSKELTVPLNTKLKIYELPDWQNVATDVQITAPQ